MENKNAFLVISNIFVACSLLSENNYIGWTSIFLSLIWLAVYVIEVIKEDQKQ